MSAVEKDFDRLALLDGDGWTPNNHHHNFLLRHVPQDCGNVLEIGCGTGAFSRPLAERAKHVTALDLSPEMIRVARTRSIQYSNIDFQIADVMSWELPFQTFDFIASIATLHHLPLPEVLAKMIEALRPGGLLVILDLFEPERDLLKSGGWYDAFLNIVAMGVSVSLRLAHNGRLQPPREVRAAWAEHGKTDSYPTIGEVRSLCAELLPGASVRKHLLWRYSVVWQKRR